MNERRLLTPREIDGLPEEVRVHLEILHEQLARANFTGSILFNFVVEAEKYIPEKALREGIANTTLANILIRQRREIRKAQGRL